MLVIYSKASKVSCEVFRVVTDSPFPPYMSNVFLTPAALVPFGSTCDFPTSSIKFFCTGGQNSAEIPLFCLICYCCKALQPVSSFITHNSDQTHTALLTRTNLNNQWCVLNIAAHCCFCLFVGLACQQRHFPRTGLFYQSGYKPNYLWIILHRKKNRYLWKSCKFITVFLSYSWACVHLCIRGLTNVTCVLTSNHFIYTDYCMIIFGI